MPRTIDGWLTSDDDDVAHYLAQKAWATFRRNTGLPPDCVELAPGENPVASHYYHTPPDHKPSYVPSDFVLVKVYQGVTFIGWTYLQEKEVAVH